MHACMHVGRQAGRQVCMCACKHTPHPTKIKKCSVFNENRHLDHIWCDESENDSPDSQRQRARVGPSNRC